MKKHFILFSLLLFLVKTNAQALFEKIESSPIVSNFSDSRSINFVDVNGDGWEDIFISNGPSNGAVHLLYLNDGAGNFTAVTEGDIVETPGPFDGATFADADNDGDLDCFAVTWYGKKNNLYFGNGDGSFFYDADALPSQPGTHSETAAWGDYDGDGLLDIYLANSEDVADPNFLYRNLGDGDFEKIETGPPVTDARRSRSVNWVDFDGDCDLDLFVANEANQPDDLYRNLGDGSFEKVTSGAPSQANRSTISSSWGDIDNDGDLDLVVVNSLFSSPQNNQLFRNDHIPPPGGTQGGFTEITTGDFVTDGGCSNGTNFGDYDNDGDLDLVVANGFCGSINFLYRNDGTGGFTRDLESIENLFTPCSYGTAWGDIDNDGFLDLGFATCRNTGAPLAVNTFYHNLGNGNNYLKIRPIGTTANRSAIGAKVWVTANIGGGEVTQMREISSQSGYCGQNSLTAHFGLGDATVATEVRIEFRCGSDTVLTNVVAGQTLEVTEAMLTPVDEIRRGDIQRLEVSPNPSGGQFRVAFFLGKNAPEMRAQLFSPTGEMMWERRVETGGNGEVAFDISPNEMGLGSGVYFLKMGGETVKLMVAEHP